MAPPTDSCRNSLHDLRDPRRWRRGHARSRGKRGPRRGRRRNARAPSPCRTGRWPNIPRTKRPPSWGPLDEPHGRRLGHAWLLHAFDRELEPAGSRRHDALPVLEDLGDKEDALERKEHRLGPEGGLRVVHEPARHIEELVARHPPVDVAGPLEVVRAFGHSHLGQSPHKQSSLGQHSPPQSSQSFPIQNSSSLGSSKSSGRSSSSRWRSSTSPKARAGSTACFGSFPGGSQLHAGRTTPAPSTISIGATTCIHAPLPSKPGQRIQRPPCSQLQSSPKNGAPIRTPTSRTAYRE